MAVLIVESTKGPGQSIELAARPYTIGRHPGQDIQIIDRLVSKQHCVVKPCRNNYELVDQGSRNGTFVNNKRITGPHLLADGDRLMVGGTRLRFESGQRLQNDVTLTESPEAPYVQSILNASAHKEFLAANLIDDPDDLRRDYEKLRFAYKLHRDIALQWDLERVLDHILRTLFEFMPSVDRAMILLRKRGSPGHFSTRKLCREGVDASAQITVSRTIIDRIEREKSALLTADAAVDERFDGSKSIVLQGMRSVLAVPMLGHDQSVLGILHMDSLKHVGAFTEQDLAIVQGFANQAALSIENTFFAERIKEDAATREKLQRFLSPNLVSKVLQGELKIEKGGEEREVTVLFSDIRAFTPLVGRHKGATVVEFLNRYFERMAEVVFDYDGTLDKFIGDALMALWGAPISSPDDVSNAVAAAIRMQECMMEFNIEAEDILGEAISIGIGLDTGPVVAGLMGSTRTVNYTVIGNHVNRASRLCAAAPPGQIFVSDTVYQKIHKFVQCEPTQPLVLKGFAQPQSVYRIKLNP